jgi:enoyl-CoA hydratase
MNETNALEAELLYEVRDGIGRVTFNRPQARNSLTFNMYERLAEICENAGKDRALKVLILTGAGHKAFASGTDINQFRAFKTPQDAIGYEARIDRVLGTLEQTTAFAPAAAPGLPRAATCASAPGPRNSAFRSRARSATACRRPISAGSRH